MSADEPVTIEHIIRTAELIAQTCEEDAEKIDGTPFTGQAVAEKLGEILANQMATARTVQALATLVKVLAQKQRVGF